VKSNVVLEAEETRKTDEMRWSQRRRQFRIAMVSYSFYDGDNRVMRYAETLAARGDHVDVISLVRPGQSSREVVRGVNVFRIQGRIINERAKWDYFGRILLFFFRALFLLTRQHLKDRYDLIHIHSVPDFLVFTALVPKLMGTKVILDIHDVLPEFYASKFQVSHGSIVFRIMLWIERISATFADHVIISNDIWLKKFTARSADAAKCSTVLNFPDPAIFHRNGRARNDGKFIMLYPGTLSWHQGLDIAIRAFHLVRNELTNAEFHIHGTGTARDSLLQLIEDLDLRDRVFIKKSLPLREIPKVIENADLGIVPKRKDPFGNEAFSTKTLEFMSLGVPLIVSDTAVDTYYFNNSVVAFFHDEDERDLARCMLMMGKHPEFRRELAENALEFVQGYSWDAKKEFYFSLVDSLASGNAGA
jgi:glycosyltransferase involved in cell wall biosynthesis